MRVGDVYEDREGRKVVILDVKNGIGYLTVEKHYLNESKHTLNGLYENEEDLLKDGFSPIKETKVLRILKEYELYKQERSR